MVKVSIIPTLLIWIVVTFLRIASHSIEPKINNLRNIQSVEEKSTEDNHSINLMIDKKNPIGMMDRRKRSSSRLIYTGPVKLKFASSKLIDNYLDDGKLKPITEADLSIGKSNRISDLNSENNQRPFNDTYGINDKNGFQKRLLVSKINVTNSADSDTAFNGGGTRLRDIVNVSDYQKRNLEGIISELRDKNLTKRDNVTSSVLKRVNEKNILRNLFEINNKTAKLTLADLNGPSISQDVESLADEKSRGLEHIRVKRDLSDSDSVDEITNEEDFNARLKDDDESEMRNDLNRKILIRRNELNNETRSAIVKPKVRSGIDEREIGSEDSLKARFERRKKRYALQSQVVGRVSRGGKKKSHRKPHKHKHKKRPKNNRHFKKMAKLSKENKKRNDVGGHRSRKTISKLNNSPGKISAVVADELQIESRVEKRDSGDARSEIDVRKREVLKNDELASKKSETLTSGVASSSLIRGFRDQEVIDGQDNDDDDDLIAKSGKDLLRVKRHEKGPATKDKISNNADELKYYEDVHELNRVERGTDVGLRAGDSGKKRQRERAAKSVKEIKNLMDKLVGKVNELDSYVEKRWESDEQRVKSKENKRGDEEDPSSLRRCVEGDLKNIKKSEDSITCVDKTLGGGFKSKLETERSGRQGVGERSSEITSEERKRSTLTSKRSDSSEKNRKKRKPHRKWDRWTDWSSCSVTCGKGRQIRWRHCVHDCTLAETEMEEKTCQLPACGPGKFLGIF